MWDVSPTKPVGKDREEGRDAEEQDDTDMRATGAQGLGPAIARREAEDGSEDMNVETVIRIMSRPVESRAAANPYQTLMEISEQDRWAMPMCSPRCVQ